MTQSLFFILYILFFPLVGQIVALKYFKQKYGDINSVQGQRLTKVISRVLLVRNGCLYVVTCTMQVTVINQYYTLAVAAGWGLVMLFGNLWHHVRNPFFNWHCKNKFKIHFLVHKHVELWPSCIYTKNLNKQKHINVQPWQL